MKILIHSNAPWVPTGYGKQAALAARLLIELGHKVSFSAFYGLGGQPISWQVPGIEGRRGQCAVYPSGQLPFSPDVIVPHARAAEADLIISVMDTYKLVPAAQEIRTCGIPFAPLVVTDSVASNDGPSMLDQRVVEESGALPAAVCRWGQARLDGVGPDGWAVPYVPHCVDTGIYKPPADRQEAREEMGTAGQFVIGICAANNDPMRKGFSEQFAAFQRFSRKHSDARLAVFSLTDAQNGLPLAQVAHDMGVLENVIFMPAYQQVAGMLSEEFMAHWYGCLDVLSQCSYAEGFGIPLLEAQACGTPVVATDGSAMTELATPAGWLVSGHRFWNASHRGWWTRPDEDQIVRAWEKAYQECGGQAAVDRRSRAVKFAQAYSLPESLKHWGGLLDAVQAYQDQKAEMAQ